MGFVFSEYVEILQESMNLNSMAAQLILALPHIQEFTSSVRCINTIYTEVHRVMTGSKESMAITVPFSTRRRKLEMLGVIGGTWYWKKLAKYAHLCYLNNAVVHTNPLP